MLAAYRAGGGAAADEILAAKAATATAIATHDHRRAVAAFLADGPEHRTDYGGR